MSQVCLYAAGPSPSISAAAVQRPSGGRPGARPILEEAQSSPADQRPCDTYEDFMLQCNVERARVDPWLLGLIMGAMCVAVYKHCQMLNAFGYVIHGATTVLMLAIIGWPGHSSKYPQYREPMVAALRLGLNMTPICRLIVHFVAKHLGEISTGMQPGFLALFVFVLGLSFASHTLRLVTLGVGLPLRGGWHVIVQLVMLAMVYPLDADLCQVILEQSGSEQAAVSGTVRGLISSLYEGMSLLPLWLPQQLQPSTYYRDPQQQCGCLLHMIQVCLGFLLPVAVILLGEARQYCTYFGRRGGAVALEGESSRPPWWAGGRVMQASYKLLGGAGEASCMDSWIKFWLSMVVLACLWQGIHGLN